MPSSIRARPRACYIAEARAALQGQGATPDGPYSHHYWYDQFGNMGFRVGWGGSFGGYLEQTLSFTNNRLNTNPFSGIPMQYDAAGNLTNDGNQSYSYDATRVGERRLRCRTIR